MAYQLLHNTDMSKFAVWTNQIILVQICAPLFTAPLCHWMFWDQFPSMTYQHSETKHISMPIWHDLSTQLCMKPQCSKATSTCLCIMMWYVLLAYQLLVIWSDLSKQLFLTHQQSEATGMSLCIMIWFVLLLATVIQTTAKDVCICMLS